MTQTATKLVTQITLAASFGGLLFGYDTAVISGAISSIDQYFIAPQALGETAGNSLLGFTVSSALFGCIIGAVVAGWLSNKLGRRKTLIIAALLFIMSAIGSALPEIGFGAIGQMGPDALKIFTFYRVIGGIGIGIASMVSPLYIAEVAPGHLRGRLVSYNQMAIVTGIVLVYFVNWFIAKQGDSSWLNDIGWRLMFASEMIPATLFLILLLPLPDSPRWLVLKDRKDEALSLLHKLEGEQQAPHTLADIQSSLIEHTRPLFSFGIALIVIGVVLSILQQAVGINAVLYYAPSIFENMGFSEQSALLQTVLVGVVNMVATVIAINTVDRVGRKPLLIIGGITMALAMAALATCFQINALGVGALLAMLLYIAGFAMSWGPVTWVLLSEIFPTSIRGKALSIAVAGQWLANIAVSWSFKVLDGNSFLIAEFNHGFAYWLYSGIAILAAFFVYRFIPETKGRTLEEIEQIWSKERTVDNDGLDVREAT